MKRHRVGFTSLLLSLFVVSALAGPPILVTASSPADEAKESARPAGGALQVAIDPITGELRPPTPEEARELAEGLRGMLNDSSEGLESTLLPDGTEVVDLDGRFMNIIVMVTDAEGAEHIDCLNSPEQIGTVVAAAAPPATGVAPGRE